MTNNIKYEAVAVGAAKPWGGHWCMQWLITINGKTFDFYTGNRYLRPAGFNKKWRPEFEDAFLNWLAKDGTRFKAFSTHGEAFASFAVKEEVNRDAKTLRYSPKAPTLDDVLHCLVGDAEALEMEFEDWAAEYGFDVDSRAALKTWKQCCKNARKLIAAGVDIAAERERLADY